MSELNPPNFRVYSAVSRRNGREELLSIGLAYLHDDRKGLNISLQALPLSPKLVLREVDELQPAPGEWVAGNRPLTLRQRMESYEHALIEQCLRDAGGRVSTVMDWLGIPRRTLSEKIARFGIDRRACLDHTDAPSVAGPAVAAGEHVSVHTSVDQHRRQRARSRANAGVSS